MDEVVKTRTKCLFDPILLAYVMGFKDLTKLHEKWFLDLSKDILKGRRRIVRLHPRGHFKTSCFSIVFPMWLYLQSFYGEGLLAQFLKELNVLGNGGIRCLLAGSGERVARGRVMSLKDVCENNKDFIKIFKAAIPEKRSDTTWSNERITLNRKGTWQECTFECIGVGGKITGAHYSIIIKDDLIGEDSLGSDGLPSEVKVQEAIQWHEYAESLLEVPERCLDLVVGTRWGMNDLIGWIEENQPEYLPPYVESAVVDGKPIFPERFSLEWLNNKRRKNPYLYSCQYENNPISKDVAEFDLGWFNRYNFNPEEWIISIKNERLDLAYMDRAVIVDPAVSTKKKADPTGMVVIARDYKDRRFVLEELQKRFEPEKLLREAFRLARKWKCRCIAIEDVASQRIFFPFARYIMENEGFFIQLKSVKPSTKESKKQRIRGLIPLAENNMIFLPQKGLQELEKQILHFPTSKDDHLIDALAYEPEVTIRGEDEEMEDEWNQDEWREEQLRRIGSTTGY